VPAPAPSAAPPSVPGSGWCAPELGHLPSGACFALPRAEAEPATELVIFLHGVIPPGGNTQWDQQRQLARAAAVHGLAVLMPRGRRFLRTDDMSDYWSWPTAADAQARVEKPIVDEWARARSELESKLGRPFAKLYFFGFSNGAYYVASLAGRGRLAADGYAAFAGGAAWRFARLKARDRVPRIPLYVGYGTGDGRAVRDATELADALRRTGWPAKVVASEGVGHAITDAQLAAALDFLRSRAAPTAPSAAP
jgi:predicted esterase